jgi:flagellar hook assembly protein FlgD
MDPGLTDNIITLTPEIFSPDNDAKDDILLIRFHLDRPGYVANSAVYDIHGRIVRQLIRNELVSPEGVFSWDGTTDESTKASIGIYIIWIELFNPDGTVKHFKKVTVLGARF